MKKIFYIGVVALFFAMAGSSFAQTIPGNIPPGLSVEPIIYSIPGNLPTVDIQRVGVINQDGNKIKVTFDIENGNQVQSGVKYSVELSKTSEKKQIFFDSNVYDESLNLGINATVHKEIVYEAPEYLSGDYDIWIKASTRSGNMLGIARAGNIKLTKTADYVEIEPASCYLNIEGDSSQKKYNLTQGVDISASENLIAVCKVKNNFAQTVKLTPNFETYYRTLFGELIAKSKEAEITLSAKEEREIKLILPKAKNPQAYDVRLTFLNDQGSIVSNGQVFHYVLQGKGATIQSFLFDKDNYFKGDTAKATLYYTLSADNFPNSRSKGSQIDGATLEIAMEDANGSACADVFTKNIDGKDILQNLKLEIPVTKDCASPVMGITLKDSNGQVLANDNFSVKSADVSRGEEAVSEVKDQKTTAFLAVLLVTLIVIITIIVWHKKNKNNMVGPMIFFTASLISGMLMAEKAQAATIDLWTPAIVCQYENYEPTHIAWPSEYGARIPNKVLSGGTLTVEGWISRASFCTNGLWQDTGIRILGSTDPFDFLAYARYNPGTFDYTGVSYGYKNITVPTVLVDTPDSVAVEGVTPKFYIEHFYTGWHCDWTFPDNRPAPEAVSKIMNYTICASVAATACTGTQVWNNCLGAFETGTKNCTPPCTPDSTCTSHTISWGSCVGACGGTGTRIGTCDNGCGGTGSKTDNTCSTPACCTCSSAENAANCVGTYTNSCGTNCTGTKDCSETNWREVAP